jgi:cytidylate kinase
VAWSVARAGIGAEDGPALRRHLESLEVDVVDDRVLVDGRDVTAEIRSQEISALTSKLTALAPVRARITPLQRRLAAAGSVVLEGRDTGTVVCPDAEVKFYLDATVETRARRRQEELSRRGIETSVEAVHGEVVARDAQDMNRALAPLAKAADAVMVDTTDLSIDEVVARMLAVIEQRCCTRS